MPMAPLTLTPVHMPGSSSGHYAHRIIEGGVGHNLPQEAPDAFAKAVIDADSM